MAGARRAVSARDTLGLRRLNGNASLVRRFERRRVKNRCRSRCNKSIVETERDRRRFGELSKEVRRGGLKAH